MFDFLTKLRLEWPLLTVVTEVNGDSKRKNELGLFLVDTEAEAGVVADPWQQEREATIGTISSCQCRRITIVICH
jgi:hypothetical protein